MVTKLIIIKLGHTTNVHTVKSKKKNCIIVCYINITYLHKLIQDIFKLIINGKLNFILLVFTVHFGPRLNY